MANKLMLPKHYFLSIIIITAMTVSYCTALTVHCSNDGYCVALCVEDGLLAGNCVNQIANFSTATAGSAIECRGINACINVTLICPTNPTVIDPAFPQRHHCEIKGEGFNEIFQSQNWTIYATNSWDDITISDYNVYTEGTMYCGTNYNASCSIQYGLWNCDNKESVCFRSKDNEYYRYCTAETDCKGTTQSCPDVAEGENTGICNFICNGYESCAATTINCGKRSQCNVLCTAESGCIGNEGTKTNINCPAGSTENCTIICGTPSTSDSCTNININAGDSRGDLNINAMGTFVLADSMIFGPGFKDINIQCNGLQSCDTATFYGNNSQQLYIGCNYDGIGAVCQDIHVYCPTNGQNCVIDGPATDLQSDLQIFARGGWNQISITDQYKANSIINMEETQRESRMHCGLKSNYDVSCLINNDWYCDCPPLPTMEPTVAPTMKEEITTMIPTESDDDDGLSEKTENGYIIGGVFVGVVIISICIGIIYWYCCVHHKPVDNTNNVEKYQKVTSYDHDHDHDAINGGNGGGHDDKKEEEEKKKIVDGNNIEMGAKEEKDDEMKNDDAPDVMDDGVDGKKGANDKIEENEDK